MILLCSTHLLSHFILFSITHLGEAHGVKVLRRLLAPVEWHGFWSFTAYHALGKFIQRSCHRNDRSGRKCGGGSGHDGEDAGSELGHDEWIGLWISRLDLDAGAARVILVAPGSSSTKYALF